MGKPVRELQFDDLSEAVEHAETLLRGGHSRQGQWSLGQACMHLSAVMRAFVEGFPAPPASARVPLWLTRNTLARFRGGRAMLIRTVTGSIGTFPEMVPMDDVDDSDGVAALRDWVDRTKNHVGAFGASPSVGVLSAPEVDALHRRHCAHHLEFLAPLPSATDIDGRA